MLAPFCGFRPLKKLLGVGFLKRLSKKWRNPFISLAYGFQKEEDDTSVNINYVQSTNRMNQEVYDSLRSSLGVNPHEFLLAHFIYRLSPILDARPNVDVILSSRNTLNSIYPKLRDRFFDEKYHLNPQKERVTQLLGKNNSWIKSRR